MADEKLNTDPAENTSPKAAEPIATPEQAAASEPRQEQTGPAIPAPSDVVVSFDKINELMVEKRQNTCAEVEKAETPEMPEVAVSGETPQPTNTEESKKLRRGRPPKAEKAATEKQNKNAVCNGVQREHNKKLNNGLPILHKVPPKRDYGRYFCIMAEKGGTSHGGLTEKLSLFFHAKKQEVNAYGR